MAAGKHRRTTPARTGVRWALGAIVAVVVSGSAGATWWALSRPDGDPTRSIPTTDGSPTTGAPTAGTPTPSTAPSSPPPDPVEPAAPRSFTIAATGDILIHSAVWERAAAYGAEEGVAFDFRPMFAPVRNLLSRADLAVCHMETPVSGDDTGLSSFPVFSVPHEIVDAAAWAGYDSCSTASNHSLDQGAEGVTETLDALDAAGIEHAGTARTKREGRRITTFEVQGVKVAHLSYSYGFNGFVPPEDMPWLVNAIDPARIVADAERARSVGAEFVIVSLHWGNQYVVPPTAYQLEVARKVTKSPAVDLVLGHHAHVVQPIDRVGRKVVVYGLGNLLSNMTTSCTGCTAGVQDGLIVHLRVVERGSRFVVDSVTYTPTWVEQGTTWRILPVARWLDQRSTTDGTRGLLEASWDRTVRAVNLLGANQRLGVIPKRLPNDRVG